MRVFPDMLQEIEPILQKDQVWVVEGGISYDDFNNGIRIRARKIELLENYRLNHARALHIKLLNGHGPEIEELARQLQPYRINDCLPLVFHRRQDGYDYRLSSGAWTLSANDECLLALEQTLGGSDFYIEYP